MKRIVILMMLGFLLIGGDLCAVNYYEKMREQCIAFGHAIENSNGVPLIGKLTNLLPLAIVATCCKQCPGQTMVILAGLFMYVIARNESVRSVFCASKELCAPQVTNNLVRSADFDDSLFVFEDEDQDNLREDNASTFV